MENIISRATGPVTSGASAALKPDRLLDCYGLLCPMPVRQTAQALEEMVPGQILKVIATDEWFGSDLEAWLRHHPHELLAVEQVSAEFHATLRK